MIRWPKFAALGLTLAAASAAVTTALAEPAGSYPRTRATVKPLVGVSLDAGPKHVVGYFVAQNGACGVTFLIADSRLEDPDAVSTAARVNMVVPAGRSARINSMDGPSVELICAADAGKLSARVIERVAYSKTGVTR